MNPADIEFLASGAGARVLADLAEDDLSDGALLSLHSRLRKSLPPSHAAAAVEQAVLRRKAVAKFGRAAAHMLFTRDALEQASDPYIRRDRAEQARGTAGLIDAACGIGSDALAFAAADIPVLGLDLDAARIAIARFNAAALGLPNTRFEIYDVAQPLPEPADLVFFDPARRDETGRRLHGVERYRPPLSTVEHWRTPRVWVKLSPAVELAELDPYPGTVEFHSVNGDLKEALLKIDRTWTGVPRTIAVRHDRDGAARWSLTGPEPEIAEAEPRGWLIEPDPALLRAGYVRHLAAAVGGTQLDTTIAYLSTDTKPDTPWARAWRVLDWMPFNLKRLKAYLRQHGVGRLTIKKRGHPMTPEQLLAALRPSGDGDERVLVLTRVKGRPAVVICASFGA
jgi:hypothetical protein